MTHIHGSLHEVVPVTAGYRCTLTYNLYQQSPSTATKPRAVAELANRHTVSQSQQVDSSESAIPHIRELKEALADDQWLLEGRVVGIRYAHAYAHPSNKEEETGEVVYV